MGSGHPHETVGWPASNPCENVSLSKRSRFCLSHVHVGYITANCFRVDSEIFCVSFTDHLNHRLSPIGVCFLIAAKILTLKSFSVLLGQLGMYFVTVMLGITIHGFVVLVIIYVIIVRQVPFRFILNISQPLATAFGTSSR